jgi:glycosyltransferase 2 family protein
MTPSRWPVKTLLAVLAASLVVYGLVLQRWGDGAVAPLDLLWSWSGLAMAVLCGTNFVLRGLRWRLWMAQLGRHFSLPVALRLYVAGYTFTPTPGNVGEVLRGVTLARQPLTLAQSLAVFGAERLADLLCLLLLCLPALGWLLRGQAPSWAPWMPVALGGLTGLAFLAVLGLFGAYGLWRWAAPLRIYLLKRFEWLNDAWTCLRLRPLEWFALTFLAWAAQGVAVWLICNALALYLPLLTASSVYAVAMVAGAVSTLPAGLGSMEATQGALLAWHGATVAQAIAITAITRVLTLWLAVAAGVLALFYSVVVSKDIRFS